MFREVKLPRADFAQDLSLCQKLCSVCHFLRKLWRKAFWVWSLARGWIFSDCSFLWPRRMPVYSLGRGKWGTCAVLEALQRQGCCKWELLTVRRQTWQETPPSPDTSVTGIETYVLGKLSLLIVESPTSKCVGNPVCVKLSFSNIKLEPRLYIQY